MTQHDHRPVALLGDVEMNSVRLDCAVHNAARGHRHLSGFRRPIDSTEDSGSWLGLLSPRFFHFCSCFRGDYNEARRRALSSHFPAVDAENLAQSTL
jgi:hypothetical protein